MNSTFRYGTFVFWNTMAAMTLSNMRGSLCMAIFTGSGVAIITPFTAQGIDFEALGRLIDFQLENGTDAIIACGTTGEPATMTHAECNAVIEYTVKRVAGRLPVIAGTGSNSTAEAIMYSKDAEALGADALLSVTPYYNKCTQKGLIVHFSAIANAVNIPIILYNVPVRTGLNMTPATLSTLADHPYICGVKEASGDIKQMSEITRLCQGRLDVYSGNDSDVVPLLSMGGKGVISTVANIVPQDVHDMVAAFFAGDVEKARNLQWKLLPLVDGVFIEVNPIPIKTALNILGMDAGLLRLPLCEMEDKNLVFLRDKMRTYGLIA